MKKLVVSLTLMTSLLVACNSNTSNTPAEPGSKHADTTAVPSEAGAATPAPGTPVNGVVAAYLQMKNALASDNSRQAAEAGKQLGQSVDQVDEASFTADQKKVYEDMKDDIKEHAEHISANGGNIAHQREHFDMLSKDLYDLVKVAHPTQTLYQTHCPMYNEGKGANWLSEVKQIKNPYLGKKMPTCGTVKEEIK